MAHDWPKTATEVQSSVKSLDATSAEGVKGGESTRSGRSRCRDAFATRLFRSGWRAGALLSCAVAFTVLLINSSVLIWTLSNSNMLRGIGTIYKGNCARAKSLNTWLQFLINVLSTALLGASNYCMQCLTSPTRREIDRAHRQKHLLRVGVPSVRNLNAISRDRVLLWLGLGLSALPLHFLYNSTIFMTTQANTYTVLAGPPSFMRPDFNVSSFYPKNFKEHLGSSYRFQHVKPYDLVDVAQEFHARMQDATAFEHLSLSQCHEGYSHQYLSSWGDLFLEIYPALVPSNNSHCTDDTRGLNSPNAEICWSMAWNDRAMTWSRIPQNTSISEVGSSLSNSSLADPFGSMSRVPTYFALSDPSSYPSYQWRDRNYSEKKSLYLNCVYNKINYSTASPVSGKEMRCRAERVPESCTLNFNLSFALIVITCNLIKLLTMSLTLSRHRAPALITTGDAIDSFLREPDETTSGLCLFSGASMYLHWEWRRGTFETSLQWKKIKQRRLDSLSSPVYEPERWFWGQSASPMRWIMCFILFLPTFVAGLLSLFLTIGSAGTFTLAVDAPVGKTLLPLHLSLFTAALIANLPQVLISYIYITFNNLFTCMLAGQEWMEFATRRKPLRVTSPTGQQRSTYWLQLPYHYSIPLLALSSVLSWLASQSLFVVRVAVRDRGQLLPPNYAISTCGYSPGAITLTLILSVVIAFATIGVGLRRYPTGMPLSATCSGAISAACHPPADEHKVAVLPVQWGVVSVKDGVGHCSFSSKMVSPPVLGRRYD